MNETECTASDKSGKLSDRRQTKFELSGSGPSYVGGGIRRSLHGIIYQLNLLMLFMKRGLEQGYNFSLATEVDAAGKFDDVVFEYKDDEGNTKHRFLQAKHKQNYDRKLNKNDLLNQTREDYSVQKYFISYLNIKNSKRKLFKGEYQDFIICTNIDIDDDIVTDFDEIISPDPLLEFNKDKCASTPKRLKFKKGTDLYKELEDILLKNADYFLIAEKLATMMVKIRNDPNKIITIEKIFTDYKDWIMQHIFDTSTEKMNGNKHYFKLRDDFLNPTDQDKVNLNEIFFNTYSKVASENENLKWDDIKSLLKESQFQLARSFLKSKPKSKAVSHQQEEIQTFLGKFLLAVNQPTEDEIKDIAQEEIGIFMNLIDSELIASKLQVCILDWAKRRHGSYITSKDCRDFFIDVENQLMSFWHAGFTLTRKSKVDKLGCVFEKNDSIQLIDEFLVGVGDEQLLLLYYDNPLLTEAKLMQLKQCARSDEFIFCDMEGFLEQIDGLVCPLKAFQSRASDQLFIMISDKTEVNNEVKIVLDKLFSILGSRKEKQVVILIPLVLKDVFDFVTEKNIGDIKFVKVFDVQNNFGDLSLESQDKLLTEAKITFQGCKITFGKLYDESLRKGISGDVLSQLVSRELKITVDNKEDQYDDEVAAYYIDRSIFRTVHIQPKAISHDDFQVINGDEEHSVEANQDTILISDSKNDYERLCQSHQKNIHWLKRKEGQLVWQESKGSISKLQKYVVRNKNEETTPELDEEYHPLVGRICWSDSNIPKKLKDRYFSPMFGEIRESASFDVGIVVNNVMDVTDKVVIIAAEPGMGKSTMLSHVASQSRNQTGCLHDLYIIKVNFCDYYDDFDMWSENSLTLEEVIKFIFKVAKFENCHSKLQKTKKIFTIQNDGQLDINFAKASNEDPMSILLMKIFTYLYNSSKIVILLDGFDEIAPKYKNKGIYFLGVLKNTKVNRIWITTRMCGIETDLENILNTFCYRINPFNMQDQKTFLINYWKNKLKIHIDMDSFNSFFSEFVIPKFRNLNTHGNEDQPSFLGIPLHIMMIATVYEEKMSDYMTGSKQNNIEKLTAYDLYDRFLKIKFHILYKEINFKDPKYDDEYEEKLGKIIERHEKFALIEMFGEDDIPEELVPEAEEETEDLLKLVTSIKEKTGLVTRVVDGRPRFVHRTFAEFFAANLLAKALLLKTTRRQRKYQAAKDFLYRLLTSPICIRSVVTFLNYKIVSTSEHAALFNAAISLDFKALHPIQFNVKDCLGRTVVHLVHCSGHFTCKNVNQLTSQEEINSLYVEDDLFKWTPWHYAIACHDCSNVEWHFGNNVNNNIKRNMKDINGVTPYILAAKHGCSNNCINAFLQELPADIDAKDNDGMTAMHYALNRNDRNGKLFACMLISMGADISVPDNNGITPFDIIMSQKPKIVLEILIKNLFNRNNYDFIRVLCEKLSSDKDFCVFVLSQTVELTQIVLENVAIDVNVQDSGGKTALHHAFQRIHLDGTDTVVYLVKNNANINLLDNDGKLPSYFNYAEAMKIFVKGHSPKTFSYLDEMVGKNMNVMKPFILSMKFDNDIIVHILSRYEYIATILLKDNDTSVDQSDSEGRTALHYAVMLRRPKNVAYLLLKGANPVTRDKNNKTPLEYVRKVTENNDDDDNYEISYKKIDKSAVIIYYLLKYGAYFDVDTDLCSELLKSAEVLFEAVKNENVDVVDDILRNSKDPQLVVNIKSKEKGRRPIHHAALRGNEEIIKVLLSYGAIYNPSDDEAGTPYSITSNLNVRSYIESSERLFLSIQNRDFKNVVKYIEDGVTVNSGYMHMSVDNIFYPLHMAIQTEQVDLVELLLKHGAKVNMRTGQDLNAFHVAANITTPQAGDIMKVLLESLTLDKLYEAFVFKDLYDDTPLVYMVRAENFHCLKLFLDKCTFYEHEDRFDGQNILDIISAAKLRVRNTDLKEIIDEIINEFSVKCDEVWNPLNKILKKLECFRDENEVVNHTG